MARVYRRGAVWWGVFERHGRRYRRSLKTADRGVAERRLGQWIEELEGLAFGEKAPRTFVEAAELFIKEHLTRLKPSSANRYALSLKSLAEQFGPLELSQHPARRASRVRKLAAQSGCRFWHHSPRFGMPLFPLPHCGGPRMD